MQNTTSHGVPGEYVTGDRYVDLTVLSIAVAVILPFVRLTLVKHYFQPCGQSALEAANKKHDLGWSKEDVAGLLTKWNESCWKLGVYSAFTLLAFMATCTEPYFWNPTAYWFDITAFPANCFLPRKLILFYALEAGYYLQAIPFLCMVEVRRKDWLESFAHHWITLGLLAYSGYANTTRHGAVIMLIHDVSDIFLEAAKLARYSQREGLATGLFAAFALSWIACRCIVYPWLVVYHYLVDGLVFTAIPHNVEPQPHYAIFGTLFMLLWFLHIYWTYLILRVIVRQLRTGSVEDVREEDD